VEKASLSCWYIELDLWPGLLDIAEQNEINVRLAEQNVTKDRLRLELGKNCSASLQFRLGFRPFYFIKVFWGRWRDHPVIIFKKKKRSGCII
jgi:hypothetical protein